jgi:hypothetical protein
LKYQNIEVCDDRETTDYIPVEAETGYAQKTDQMDVGEPDDVDYRSIDTPKKVELQEEPKEEYSAGESFDEYVKRRTIEFNRQLDEVSANEGLGCHV